MYWRVTLEVRREYLNNLYHSFYHAADTTHGIFRYANMVNALRHLSYVDTISILTAAFCHDMGHPGVSNAYLVTTRNQLAMTYNDRAPLENMHCASLYAILR